MDREHSDDSDSDETEVMVFIYCTGGESEPRWNKTCEGAVAEVEEGLETMQLEDPPARKPLWTRVKRGEGIESAGASPKGKGRRAAASSLKAVPEDRPQHDAPRLACQAGDTFGYDMWEKIRKRRQNMEQVIKEAASEVDMVRKVLGTGVHIFVGVEVTENSLYAEVRRYQNLVDPSHTCKLDFLWDVDANGPRRPTDGMNQVDATVGVAILGVCCGPTQGADPVDVQATAEALATHEVLGYPASRSRRLLLDMDKYTEWQGSASQDLFLPHKDRPIPEKSLAAMDRHLDNLRMAAKARRNRAIQATKREPMMAANLPLKKEGNKRPAQSPPSEED